MATKIGTRVLFDLGTKVLVGQRGASLSRSSTMIETSSKTSGNHAEFEAGRISSTMSVEGIASTSKEATLAGYWELYDAQEARTKVLVSVSEYTDETGATPVTGAEKFSQYALISGLDASWPDNAENTFTCNIQLTGAPIRQTNVASGQPVANAGPNQTVNEGATVTLDGSASTNGGSGTVTYLWTPPAGITLSSNTIVNPTFTAPAQTTYAEYEFSLQVYNGTLYSFVDKVVITVVNVP